MQTIVLGDPQPASTPDTFKIDLPPAIGRGGIDIRSFASGLRLIVVDLQPHQPTAFFSAQRERSVGFGFCLNGRFDCRVTCCRTPFTVEAGESGFLCFPESIERVEKIRTPSILRVYLIIDDDFLPILSKGEEDLFSPVLNRVEQKHHTRVIDTITPLMQAVLHQILHCPYSGMTGQLFLESKAMELLAHKIEQLHPNGRSSNGALKSSDQECVHHAAEVLVNNLENPPDMNLLARSVGLSRSKLHRCFRLVYGLSPFEYLRNKRLQTAMQLLQGGEVNVTEAALSVGYANLSYFAKAFKNTFGLAPGELLKRSWSQ
ncbi:transcriptional regulator, AraC family [Desulfosarcina variabilis str. Montpellier]|uniref:helix-turn-helix transcriptional regulator n=1 Tax=Desulfosarcina variabilis TaxID=2300 RepID=UPI003AFA5B7A